MAARTLISGWCVLGRVRRLTTLVTLLGCAGGALELRGGPGAEPTALDVASGRDADPTRRGASGSEPHDRAASVTDEDLDRFRAAPASAPVQAVMVVAVPRRGLVVARRALANGATEGCVLLGAAVTCGPNALEAAIRAHGLAREPARIDGAGWTALIAVALDFDLDTTRVVVDRAPRGGLRIEVRTRDPDATGRREPDGSRRLHVAVAASGAVRVEASDEPP
ncbi:MAG: hypothetical protein NZ898_10655 [Myxococcota bacterium]|nr:hypothetical protein [Myxococcota bacterium]